MSLYGEQLNDLLFVGFNQDSGCFACGTDTGFRVFNVDPFREAVWRSFANGGIGKRQYATYNHGKIAD